MITTCTKCGALYEAGSEEQAYEPERFCFQCVKQPLGYCEANLDPALQPAAPTSKTLTLAEEMINAMMEDAIGLNSRWTRLHSDQIRHLAHSGLKLGALTRAANQMREALQSDECRGPLTRAALAAYDALKEGK